jgi:hypothetical protein
MSKRLTPSLTNQEIRETIEAQWLGDNTDDDRKAETLRRALAGDRETLRVVRMMRRWQQNRPAEPAPSSHDPLRELIEGNQIHLGLARWMNDLSPHDLIRLRAFVVAEVGRRVPIVPDAETWTGGGRCDSPS